MKLKKTVTIVFLVMISFSCYSQFDSKELMLKYYDIPPSSFISDSIASYSIKEYKFELEFHKLEFYTQKNKQYCIAIFGHHPLHKNLDGKITRGIWTGAIGEAKFSVLKFKKNKNRWNFVSKYENLDIGYNDRSYIKLPEIKKVENFIFLDLSYTIYPGAGTIYKTTTLFNVENFKPSLEINCEGYQSGTNDVDTFIKEMNVDSYDEMGNIIGEDCCSINLWSASNYEMNYLIEDQKLYCIVDVSYGHFDEKTRKFIKEETTSKYYYDEETMKFLIWKNKIDQTK